MLSTVTLREARKGFHSALFQKVLRVDDRGVPSIADKDSKTSVHLASALLAKLKCEAQGARLAGQIGGSEFEAAVKDFVELTFKQLSHLRPGEWHVTRGGQISQYEQYSHLAHIKEVLRSDPQLATALGSDYMIKPDVLVWRKRVDDDIINNPGTIVEGGVGERSALRTVSGKEPLLHASISCKLTIRSDRAQNARSEALNLIRTRKGRVPHVVTVTAEPLPSRLASLALGTGDIDCVYHFALNELLESTAEFAQERAGGEETRDLLRMMVEGKRLKDIADLPLDLSI